MSGINKSNSLSIHIKTTYKLPICIICPLLKIQISLDPLFLLNSKKGNLSMGVKTK